MYGTEPMQTMTVRVSKAERERIDALAAAMSSSKSYSGYWGPKYGRGDVVRLALLVLEQRVTDDVEESAAWKAQQSLYRTSAPIDERVDQLRGELRPERDTKTPAPAAGGAKTKADELVELLERKPGRTAAEIADELGVEPKYPYRLLRQLGDRVVKDDGYWYLQESMATS